MKIIAFVIFLGFYLSFAPFVLSIKCIMCDPEHEGSGCKQTYIDCSQDYELGQSFDSCFTYQVVIDLGNGANFTHLDKNCSISDGCEELKSIMCKQYNDSVQGAVQSCDILCCDGDYCNIGKPKFTRQPDISAHTRATTQHNVLGYRSTASRHAGDKWKYFSAFFVLLFVIYSVVSSTLL